MGSEWGKLAFIDAVEINPRVMLKKGHRYPFVDMKAVDPSSRNVSESEYRDFSGGGSRFKPSDTLVARITPCLENGKIARYVPAEGNEGPAFGSTEFIIIRGRDGVTDNNFAYYLTQWHEFRQFAISQMTGSSGRQRVPAESFSNFTVPVPPLSEQRAIAHILGSLDDKIELNRKMNETLEEMARAIFKSWFMDFLPVRAKMAAKAQAPRLLLPQAEPGIWFVYAIDCQDGSIYIGQTEDLRQRWQQHLDGRAASWTKQHQPLAVVHWEKLLSREAAVEREKWLKTGFGRKWLKKQIAASTRTQTGDPVHAKADLPAATHLAAQAGCLLNGLPKEIADLFPDSFEDSVLGDIPKGWEVVPLPEIIAVNPLRTLRRGEIAPYLDMANMPTRTHSPDVVVERPFGSGMRFINGDTLIARITPCLENGKTAYVDFLQEGQVGWGSTEYIVLRPKQPIPLEYAYCLARSAEFRDFAIQSMTGSSGRQRVQVDALSHFIVVSPSEKITELFGKLVKPLFTRAKDASDESRTLAAIRDTLLPKLLTGEIFIKDAEKFIR